MGWATLSIYAFMPLHFFKIPVVIKCGYCKVIIFMCLGAHKVIQVIGGETVQDILRGC